MSRWETIGKNCFNILLNALLSLASSSTRKEVERRNAARQRSGLQWLTAEESAVAEHLARIVVPSEDEAPGIDEVCVLGASVIELLDKMILADATRQQLYAWGLLSFDNWAMREHGRKFVDIPPSDQTNLFRGAQEMYDGWMRNGSAGVKAWRRLKAATRTRTGSYFAAALYPRIRDDCLQIFYTSRVSWIWLGYDGPPMEEGYPGLKPRR